MRRYRLLTFALTTVVLAACEYSPVPLSDPEEPVDARLAGWWEWVGPAEGDTPAITVLVLPFNAREYYLECVVTRPPDPDLTGAIEPARLGSGPAREIEPNLEISRFRAFTTTVRGVRFANLGLLAYDDGIPVYDEAVDSYWLARYSLDADGRLRLRFVADSILSVGEYGREALRRLVEERADDESLFGGDEVVFRRIEPGENGDEEGDGSGE